MGIWEGHIRFEPLGDNAFCLCCDVVYRGSHFEWAIIGNGEKHLVEIQDKPRSILIKESDYDLSGAFLEDKALIDGFWSHPCFCCKEKNVSYIELNIFNFLNLKELKDIRFYYPENEKWLLGGWVEYEKNCNRDVERAFIYELHKQKKNVFEKYGLSIYRLNLRALWRPRFEDVAFGRADYLETGLYSYGQHNALMLGIKVKNLLEDFWDNNELKKKIRKGTDIPIPPKKPIYKFFKIEDPNAAASFLLEQRANMFEVDGSCYYRHRRL